MYVLAFVGANVSELCKRESLTQYLSIKCLKAKETDFIRKKKKKAKKKGKGEIKLLKIQFSQAFETFFQTLFKEHK